MYTRNIHLWADHRGFFCNRGGDYPVSFEHWAGSFSKTCKNKQQVRYSLIFHLPWQILAVKRNCFCLYDSYSLNILFQHIPQRWPLAMASCQMKFSHLVKVIAETTPTTWQAPHSLRAQRWECKEEEDQEKQEADEGEQKLAQLGKLAALAARGSSRYYKFFWGAVWGGSAGSLRFHLEVLECHLRCPHNICICSQISLFLNMDFVTCSLSPQNYLQYFSSSWQWYVVCTLMRRFTLMTWDKKKRNRLKGDDFMFQDVRPDESGDQERGWESRLRRESESHPLTPPSWRDIKSSPMP